MGLNLNSYVTTYYMYDLGQETGPESLSFLICRMHVPPLTSQFVMKMQLLNEHEHTHIQPQAWQLKLQQC